MYDRDRHFFVWVLSYYPFYYQHKTQFPYLLEMVAQRVRYLEYAYTTCWYTGTNGEGLSPINS